MLSPLRLLIHSPALCFNLLEQAPKPLGFGTTTPTIAAFMPRFPNQALTALAHQELKVCSIWTFIVCIADKV